MLYSRSLSIYIASHRIHSLESPSTTLPNIEFRRRRAGAITQRIPS